MSDDYLGEDDILIKRDEDGELVPVDQDVPMLGGQAKVIPMAYGRVQRLFGGIEQGDELDEETVKDILTEHVEKPDLSDMSVDDLRKNMKPMAPQALLLAVMQASGVTGDLNVDEDGEPELDLDLGNSPS